MGILEDRLAPAVLTVNSFQDTASSSDAYLSLREAIAIVNSETLPASLSGGILGQINGPLHDDGVDTIRFDPDLSDPIVLGSGQLTLSVPSSTSIVTIDGGLFGVTIDGNNASRVFSVAAGVEATFSDLTIINGKTGLVFDGVGGGGIRNAGNLTVVRGTFTGNTSSGDMGTGGGGAIGNAGTLAVIDSSFTNNVSDNNTSGGSGLYNEGTATVVGSTFFQNGAVNGSNGGAIAIGSGQVYVLNSTFSANTGIYGSAIFVGIGDALTVVNSTFANNEDGGFGGNGVIYTIGAVTAINSVFSGNTAGGGPGTAIDSDNGGPAAQTINNSYNTGVVLAPLADNGGPTRTRAPLPGSPVIGTGVAPTTINTPVTSTVTPTVIVGNATALVVVPGYTVILVGTEQMLVTAVSGSTLTVVRGYNGTTAATHDEDDAVYPATDQRGVSRLTNGISDIGAFQSTSVPQTPTPTVTTPAAAQTVPGGDFVIQGTAEAGSLVRVYHDVNNNGVIDVGDMVVGTQQLGVGITNYAITTPLMSGAANNFLATATGVDIESAPANVPTLTVAALSIESSTAPAGIFGQLYSFAPAVSGGEPGYTFSVSVGSLPDGLTLNPSTGVIFGTPTAVGTSSFTLSVTDAGSSTDTQAFTLRVNAVPALTGSGNPVNANSGGTAVAVDPNLTIAANGLATLATATVSITANFDSTEDALLFTNQNGITGSYNAASGILTLTGTASVADYQTALRSVRYRNTDGASPGTDPRTISFSIAPAVFNPANGHFYEFVTASGISWTNAAAAAAARSIFGLQGYLTTLTSAEENAFAFAKVNGLGWIGASDAAVEGEWRWTGGPEAGTQFWSGGPGTGKGAAGTPVNGAYSNWADGEPNNAGDEDYAHFQPSAMWNDYPDTAMVSGYVVEYGGSAGDPVLQVTSQTQVNVVVSTAAPLVTSPAAAQVVNAATSTVAGTAEAGSLVRVYVDVNNNGVIDAGDAVVATQQLAAGTAFSITVPLTPDAANNFLVTATLSPSAESSPTDVPTIIEDSTAPVTPTVSNPTVPLSVNAAMFPIAGTAEAGSLVKVYRDVNNNGVIDAGDAVVGTQVAATGSYSIAVPLTADTANDFLVTATDAAGNESVVADVPTITEDSTAPIGPTVSDPTVPLSVNAATFPIAGTAEAGSLVKVYRDVNNNGVIDAGDAVVGTQVAATGSYSIAVPLTADAANDFLVTATDAAGNESVVADVPTITEDSTAPVTPTVSTPTAPLSVNTATFAVAGTAEADSLVKVYHDANNNGILDAGDTVVGTQQLTLGATAYGITVPMDQDAVNAFLVTATDAAGNESVVAVVPLITEDSTAPAMPSVSSPAAAVTVNAPSFLVTGTAEAGSFVTVYVDANNNGILDDGDTIAGTQQLALGLTGYDITVTLTPDAVNAFLITSTDAAGNESIVAIVPLITEDSTAPVAPTVSGPAIAVTVNAPSFLVTGTAEAGSFVTVYVDANNNGILDDGDTVAGSQELAPGVTNYAITVALTQDAVNHFLVTSTDVVGNVSAATVVPLITEDSTAPAMPSVNTPAAAVTVNAATILVAGTAEAGSFVTVYVDANNNGILDDGDTIAGTQQLAPGVSTYSITVPLTQDAANPFLVVATDAGGNVSVAAVVPPITEDSTAPAAPSVITPAATITVNAAASLVAGTAEAGSFVTVYVDANNNGILDDGDTIAGTQQLAPGVSTYSITVPLTQDAANPFLVVATDAGGNVSVAAVVPPITEDSTAPAAPSVSSPLTTTAINAEALPITGTAEAGSLVTVYVDGNGNGILDDGDTVAGSQQLAPGETAYAITVPLAPDAANPFLVTSTDAADNESIAAVVPLISEDSTNPPAPTVSSPTAAQTVDAANLTLTGTAEAGSLVTVYRDVNGNGILDAGDTVAGTQQLAPGETAYSITVPLAPDAANPFLVTATDSAGNESITTVVPAITEDSANPMAPSVATPSTATTVNAATLLVTGTAEAGSLVTVYRDVNGNGILDDGDTITGTQLLAAGETAYSITVPLTPDATNRFLVTATDSSGHGSIATAVPTVTEDSTAPAAPSVSTLATTINAATIPITGTAEAGSLVTLYVDANGNGIHDDGDTVAGTQRLAPGVTAYSITVPLATNAANRFLATATDSTGNESIAAAVPLIAEDSTAPTDPTVSSPTAAQSVDAADLAVTGTAEAGSLVTVYRDLNGNGIVDAGDTVAGTQQLPSGMTPYSIQLSLTQNAANHFLVVASDVAGNTSTAAVVPTVTEDSTAPAAPTITLPSTRVSTIDQTYVLTGVAEAGSLVTVYIDANGNGAINSGEVVVGTSQLAPDATVYRITISLALNAENHFLVTATDDLGKVSPTTAVPNIVQGSLDPSVPLVFSVGSDEGGQIAQLYNADGTIRLSITPFPDSTGGVRVSTADVNGDGVPDLVVGTGPGVMNQVKVYDGRTGAVLAQMTPFEASFTGGVFVKAADLNGDGKADLIVTADQGGGARVKIFDGVTGAVLANFMGIDDPDFRGGARVTTGDVNGDGIPDVIVAAGFGGGPRVSIFDGAALRAGTVQRIANFFVFEDTLRNGVYITAGDIDGDGFADVVAGGGPGGGPRVFAISGKDLVETGAQVPVANFFAGDPTTRNGIRVATADLDLDGRADLIIGSGRMDGSEVLVYLAKNIAADGTPSTFMDFDAFNGTDSMDPFTGGVFVG
ncbi:Ig-like domain-containing protein [Limnoglobus roseus]|uniref:Ig-like domain-containing protein n=1 Tax=Limnoglobus roseus TaxID=2598579 RepID=UPI0011EA8BE5|nr:Ig-like domain-containing protein [Limnoglobus roseus]